MTGMKSCPFCGGKVFKMTFKKNENFETQICCESCNLKTSTIFPLDAETVEESRNKMAEKWNRRAQTE